MTWLMTDESRWLSETVSSSASVCFCPPHPLLSPSPLPSRGCDETSRTGPSRLRAPPQRGAEIKLSPATRVEEAAGGEERRLRVLPFPPQSPSQQVPAPRKWIFLARSRVPIAASEDIAPTCIHFLETSPNRKNQVVIQKERETGRHILAEIKKNKLKSILLS